MYIILTKCNRHKELTVAFELSDKRTTGKHPSSGILEKLLP